MHRAQILSLCPFAAASAGLLIAISADSLASQNTRRPATLPFSVVEASISGIRTALEQKRTTSREIVVQYLARIALYEDRLNAVGTVNPNALH